jgi:hypothetical protein
VSAVDLDNPPECPRFSAAIRIAMEAGIVINISVKNE